MITTARLHAIVEKKIINYDSGKHIICMWADCEREGLSTYRLRWCRHQPHVPCDQANAFDVASHIRFAFCTEKHLNYFRFDHGPQGKALLESRGGQFGYLPTGYRGGIL